MKIIILYPNASKESATDLAKALKCKAENPFEQDKRDYREYDLVINYGCNRNIKAKKILNTPKAVACCINKYDTFKALYEAGIPIPQIALNKDDIKGWGWTVARKTVTSSKNDGMILFNTASREIPDAKMYVKYFEHKKEFRIVILNGTCVAAYEKVLDEDTGIWSLYEKTYRYLDPIISTCIHAAKAIGIDYAGFDVVVNNDNEYVILEANSGPILTEESILAFKEYMNG